MGKTSIEWASDTWPIITGCSPASEGCRNCYAARLAATRLKHHAHYAGLAEMVNGHPRWTGKVRFNEDVLGQPLRWKKPRVVFPCSMSDWLHPSIPHDRQAQMLDVMADERCEKHIFLLLTKRPENHQDLLWWMGECWPGDTPISVVMEVDLRLPDNIWPGVTVESQDQMWRLEELFKIPAARYWISLEPLLGPVEIPPELLAKLSGMVVGGESGPGARPMHPDWARGIRDQCLEAGVPFTLKQWGEWLAASQLDDRINSDFAGMPPMLGALAALNVTMFQRRYEWPDGNRSYWFGKKAAGRELDGQIWDEFPWKLIKEA